LSLGNYAQVEVFDVVVIGFGAAGASAAIEAAKKGAKVAILEKTEHGGGNTIFSAAFICPDNEEKALKYILELKKIEQGVVSEEDLKIVKAFVSEATKLVDWIKELGGEVEPGPILPGYPKQPIGPSFPQVDGADSIKRYRVSGPEVRGGESLFKLLASKVKELNITVFYKTSAKELIHRDGEVLGVVAEKDGKESRIMARRGVILACGGYEYDDALKRLFFGGKVSYALGNPSNTGDGVRMAMQVGAALWHMHCFAGYPGFKTPEKPYAFPIRMWLPAFIYVDRYGKRFMNEAEIEAHISVLPFLYFDPIKLEYPRIPCFVIFDEKNREAGPLSPHRAVYGEWSSDNLVEIEKGWIVKADDIKELALKLGVPPENLETTVTTYNSFCKEGYDLEFGRTADELLPIDRPPYYGIVLEPCILNTQGGPKRDERCRVVDIEGKPIKRLYSAGELGSMWGLLYQSGGNIAECLVSGRIAGRNVVEEPALRE